MKLLQSTFFRALCAIIVGALIIQYREDTAQWLTISVGVLFFISGIISCAIYYSQKKHAGGQEVYDANGQLISGGSAPAFPIVGLGSIILGVILALMPSTFLTGLMYILAAILVLGALNQYIGLALARRFCHVGWFYWIAPTLILLAAIYIMVRPMDVIADTLFFIGWCMLLYGVVEALNGIKIYKAHRIRNAREEAAKQAAEAARQTPIEVQPATADAPEALHAEEETQA